MEEIIKNAFDEKVQIIDIIKLGLRCETYVVKVKEEKYIFQIYLENAIM